VKQYLLGITSVHPMRKDAVGNYLARAGVGWPVVRRLVAQGKLVEVEHMGRTFYLRKLSAHHEQETR